MSEVLRRLIRRAWEKTRSAREVFVPDQECGNSRMCAKEVSRGPIEDRGPKRGRRNLFLNCGPFAAGLEDEAEDFKEGRGWDGERMYEDGASRTSVDDGRPERGGTDSFLNFDQSTAVPEVEATYLEEVEECGDLRMREEEFSRKFVDDSLPGRGDAFFFSKFGQPTAALEEEARIFDFSENVEDENAMAKEDAAADEKWRGKKEKAHRAVMLKDQKQREEKAKAALEAARRAPKVVEVKAPTTPARRGTVAEAAKKAGSASTGAATASAATTRTTRPASAKTAAATKGASEGWVGDAV